MTPPPVTAEAPPPLGPATIPPPTPTALPQEISLVAGGDVIFSRLVRKGMVEAGDPTWPFQNIRPWLLAYDIFIFNLESPFAEPCPEKTIGLIFCAPTEAMAALEFSGVDVVNTANNHHNDQGSAGRRLTTDLLNSAGVLESNETKVVVKEINGIRFGFLGFNRVAQGPGADLMPAAEILQRIDEAKQAADVLDVLVVSFHWGEEYDREPNETQEWLGRAAVDSGADLVLGTGPHVVQRVEPYNGGVIVYSLGNLVFDSNGYDSTRTGLLVIFRFSGSQLTAYELQPVSLTYRGQPSLVGTPEPYSP
jgi:poly-gamma-glutamate synthesis protein (capsule biosynthesis protein)